ncbi:hypothetical protein AB1283_00660 [Bacillus sp. S13(2024)]|uniref:hypothetical protein n=1 Tax=Bacillus sp. S13(2024) TaxID=3162885 RepID=UPI003D23FB4F
MSKNKPVYILSLEASEIYSHMHRNGTVKHDYCGMIPFSLELIELRKEGLKVKHIESRDKEISNDIINVKFNQKVKSGNELKKILLNKKEQNGINEKYISKLNEFINLIEEDETNEKWNCVSVDELRKILYTEGFKIRYENRNGNTKEIEYVVYKRSSSKSRTGQCLFIKKSLYNKMIKWSRMHLPLKKDMEIDLAGLLAYESLVGSSLESTVKINPDKILLVDDVDSKFERMANVVRKGNDGFLDSFKEKATISNSLFDGQSLLEEKYFEAGVSMKLLRNHMFKSAAFNCNIQKFLKDNCPKGINYDHWQLTDMFGNKIYAKDVELICTPSSVKALKFSSVIGKDKDMWEHWKQKVKEDESIFGVCKHEKQSKFGVDEKGNVLQQTSYQMINCLPMAKNDIKELTKTEREYIERLKNDDDFFIEKVKNSSTLVNSNEMLTALYNHNKNIINTKLFKDFRKGFIRNHVDHSKKGKIKLNGDYCVMIGNPMEYLKHAIGQFNIHKPESTLKNNEVYTKLFDFNKEYVGFRNPNTSPSNVLIVKNKKVKEIENYFNFTENIVCVNAVHFEIQDILSGCDYDSDTVLLFNDPKLLELGKKCFGSYNVCVNNIDGQKKKYKLNKYDMYEIDNQLSTSQKNIGKVVNLGQFCMSVYWDLLNKGETSEHVEELLKKVDVMTILSGIAIDMAKKFYEINIDKEINHVEKNIYLKERKNKPNFWKYVSQSKTIKDRIEFYECPMDYLSEDLNKIKPANQKETLPFEDFLIKSGTDRSINRNINKIIKNIKMKDNLIRLVIASPDDQDEKMRKIEDIITDLSSYIKKIKLKEGSIYNILVHSHTLEGKIMMRLLKVLYEMHGELLLKSIKNT